MQNTVNRRFIVLVTCTIVVFCYLMYPVRADPDLWGHVFYGGHAWAQGSLPTENTYSFTHAGYPWVNHEWLFEVLSFLAFDAMGSAGLILFLAGWLTLTGIVIAKYIRRFQQTFGQLRTQTLVVSMLFVAPILKHGITIRPRLSTFLFTVIFIVVLDELNESNRVTWRLYTLPVIMILWTNMHGGFLVGFALLGAFVGYQIVRPLVQRETGSVDLRLLTHGATAAILSVLAALVNPYGYHLFTWIYGSLSEPRPDISEWQSIFQWWDRQPLIAVFLLVFPVLVGLIVWYRKRSFSFVWLSFICIGLMAIKHVRFIPLALLTALLALLMPLDQLIRRVYEPDHVRDRLKQTYRALAGATTSLLAFVGTVLFIKASLCWVNDGFFRVRLLEGYYPVEAVHFIKENGIQGNLGCHFNWGQYLIWHLFPDSRVWVDGRFRTAYPSAYLNDYLDFNALQPGTRSFLETYEPTLVLYYTDSKVSRMLQYLPDWTLLHEDEIAVLYARHCPENEELIAAHQQSLLESVQVPGRTYFP